MLKFSAYDKYFVVMLRKAAPYFSLVMHKCLHPYGHNKVLHCSRVAHRHERTEILGFTLDCRRSSNYHSACGMAWHQMWTGKLSDVPLITPMKWSFHVWIAFSAKLRR